MIRVMLVGMITDMELDKLDFDTLDALHEGGVSNSYTTSEVAKTVFSDLIGDVELSNLDSRIRSRLNKLYSYGVVVKDDGSRPVTYNLDYNSIIYGKAVIEAENVSNDSNKQYSLEVDKMLLISNKKGVTLCGFVPDNEAPNLH